MTKALDGFDKSHHVFKHITHKQSEVPLPTRKYDVYDVESGCFVKLQMETIAIIQIHNYVNTSFLQPL